MEVDKIFDFTDIFNHRYESQGRLSSNILRRPQKFGKIFNLVLTILSNLKKNVGYFFNFVAHLQYLIFKRMYRRLCSKDQFNLLTVFKIV